MILEAYCLILPSCTIHFIICLLGSIWDQIMHCSTFLSTQNIKLEKNTERWKTLYYWSLVEPSNFKSLVFILNLRLETNFLTLFCFGKMNNSWKNQVFPKLQFYYKNPISKVSKFNFDIFSLIFLVFWYVLHLVQL